MNQSSRRVPFAIVALFVRKVEDKIESIIGPMSVL